MNEAKKIRKNIYKRRNKSSKRLSKTSKARGVYITQTCSSKGMLGLISQQVVFGIDWRTEPNFFVFFSFNRYPTRIYFSDLLFTAAQWKENGHS